MDLDEVTIAQQFQKAGYATAAFGKWHNGMQYPYHPNARGFDEFYGFCSGHWGHYFSPMLERNGEIVRGEGFCVDDFTQHAMEFITQHREKPFFVYLPYNIPHSPMQVPDRFWRRFKDKQLTKQSSNPAKEQLDHTRAALAMCENIDWNVGRILKLLDDLQLSDDTIVVYFNDNGPNGWRWNLGLKGKKGSTDEGGVRSPLMIRWPGKVKSGSRIVQISGAIDLLPTLCALCDVPVPENRQLDGRDLKPELLGQLVDRPARMIFSHWNNRLSVRSNRFRLDHKGQLYDIWNDAGQTQNVNDQHPDEVQRLADAVAEWRKNVLSELGREIQPFTVGHPGCRFTQLPARDATATGGIKRSNRFPNCSYFTNWKNENDFVAWPVDVLQAGDYEAKVYYAGKANGVGAELELSQENGAAVSGIILVANDPPEAGAAEDRFPRMESYVKDFRPMDLGVIRLRQGKGRLKLSAKKLSHGSGVEVRLLFLTREQ